MPDRAGALIEISGVEKQHGGLRPLRIAELTVRAGDRYVLSGFDAGAAEAFVHLVTGAALPDRGSVRVDGRATRDIATDHEWLSSLDRFGIVTERAVLLDALTIEANLALPLTVAIDPMPPPVREKVRALAGEVGLAPERLAAQAAMLGPEERARVHLARALAQRPAVLLLEHPTARLGSAAAAAFGHTLAGVAAARQLAWVALTEDDAFARAAGGTRLRLDAATGRLMGTGFWRGLLSGHRAKGLLPFAFCLVTVS